MVKSTPPRMVVPAGFGELPSVPASPLLELPLDAELVADPELDPELVLELLLALELEAELDIVLDDVPELDPVPEADADVDAVLVLDPEPEPELELASFAASADETTWSGVPPSFCGGPESVEGVVLDELHPTAAEAARTSGKRRSVRMRFPGWRGGKSRSAHQRDRGRPWCGRHFEEFAANRHGRARRAVRGP
jgi:hypothetical protein